MYRQNLVSKPDLRLNSNRRGQCSGHSRHFDRAPTTSGLPRLPDILRGGGHVSKVPTATTDARLERKGPPTEAASIAHLAQIRFRANHAADPEGSRSCSSRCLL